jgi:UDP-N-acetylmuramoyl-L-alanyl-D-glutamate--2,6-diaminopimelate ligase
MKLRELLIRLHRPLIDGDPEVEVASVTADSRAVEMGAVFVAVRGRQADGRRFVRPAVEAGAVAVVSESPRETGDPTEVAWIQVADARAALSALAAALQGDPSQELKLVGVTGTNGKTTTVFLCHHLLQREWHRAGMLGTVRIDDGETQAEASHTTPDAVALQAIVRRMVDHGCRGAAMEVSSHGIDQKRVADLAFDALVFTNLSQDHLDYHGTMEAYAEAKMSWFEATADHPRGKKPVAIVHGDDTRGDELAARLQGRLPVVRFGFGVHNDFRALDFRQTPRGTEFKLETKGRSYLVRTPLIGRFNALNALAALAAVRAVGVPLRAAIAALAESPQVPGRLEHCGSRDGVNVYVDYAHTPDALEHVCRTLKELEPRRLLTVFGCGGDRDRGKRPLMAKAAARHSDACILTSDNPRSEDPEKILREMEAGMGNARYRSVVDRAEAIRIAVHAAGPGDMVLIAGKGHETYQQFDGRTISFDDRNQARIAMQERPAPERGRES